MRVVPTSWASVVAVLVLGSACVDEVDFELLVSHTVDFDALTEGLFPAGDFSVTDSRGVTIPLTEESIVDISGVSAEAWDILDAGGIADVLSVGVRIASNSANTDLSDLRVAMAYVSHTDPATSELTGVIPFVRGSGGDVTFEWVPNGEAWLEHFAETGTFKVYLLGDIELSQGDRIPYGATEIQLRWQIRAQSQ